MNILTKLESVTRFKANSSVFNLLSHNDVCVNCMCNEAQSINRCVALLEGALGISRTNAVASVQMYEQNGHVQRVLIMLQ